VKTYADGSAAVTAGKRELRGEISPKQQPMWLTGPVVETLHADRGVVKRIAIALEIPEREVYRVADAQGPRPLPAYWMPTIIGETGSFAILDAVEARVGRVAFPLPVLPAHHDELNRELARTVTMFGEFLQVHGETLADGVLEAYEAATLLRALDDVIAGACEYRALVVTKARQDETARVSR
jgi:hypothetical protein